MQPTRFRPIALLALVAGLLLPGATPALAADPVEVVFNATGAEQSWVVPDNVTSIHVVLIGGNGGDAGSAGLAHVVTGDLAVLDGTTLFIEVGGNGAPSIGLPGAAGGFNGGGAGGSGTDNAGAGGGGASDIRTITRSDPGTLASRLMVAGGGGGRGGGTPFGGVGGSAGSDGARGDDPFDTNAAGFGGLAGTSAAGGFGGTGFGSGSVDGSNGVFGAGGAGGTATNVVENGGGGGGGGFYGGGGGGAGSVAGHGGGGGGGSSFVGFAQNAFVSPNIAGDPSITITYEVDPDPPSDPDTGVVDADVTVPTSAACIELSATSVTFGTQRFGTEDVPATPSITVTNCSGSDETLLARGTDASGNGAGWNLVDAAGTCGAGTLALDDYHLTLKRGDTEEVTRLSTNNKAIRPLAAGAEGTLDALIDMPCPGSSGAGQTMGMQIVFVVTE
jgi:hypothetical protein